MSKSVDRFPYPMYQDWREHFQDTRVIHNIPPSLFTDTHLIRTTAVWGESIILIMPPGIGTVRCSWLNGDSSTMIISDLAVAEAYRCRGVARTLILRAERIATLSASPTILLSVNPDSFMRQAYMRYGFRPTGEQDENGLDIMTKKAPTFKIRPVQFPNITYGPDLRALPKGARIIVQTVSGEVVRGAYQGLVDSLSHHDKAIMILNDDGLIIHVEFSDIRKDHKPTNLSQNDIFLHHHSHLPGTDGRTLDDTLTPLQEDPHQALPAHGPEDGQVDAPD